MKILKSIKTRLIIQISLLIIISTLFVLVFVNIITRNTENRDPSRIEIEIDPSLTIREQREIIRKEIERNIIEERNSNAARLIGASVVGIIFQIIFTSLGIYFLIQNELKPLSELNKTIQEINQNLKYLTIKIDEDSSEELLLLTENFNHMILRLEKAFNSQREFVENVSHEIKTPLTIVKSNLESILLNNDQSGDEYLASIKEAVNSIDFLNKLVEDLLLLSFIDKKNFKSEKVMISQEVKSIIDRNSNLIKSSSFEVTMNLLEKDVELVINPTLFEKVIINLVENAIKYHSGKKEIIINIISNKSEITIEISNYGNKIPEEYSTKIFERFFRIEKSRSRLTGGLGLGLAITKEIVELFKGKIFLESKDGMNTFKIQLRR